LKESQQENGRPKWGKYSTYTPQKTIDYENLVKFSYLSVTNDKIIDEPIKIKIKAYFEPPKSTSKKKYKELIGKHYTKKPDIDNIAKAILDGLNGIAYGDDNQISELEIQKIYSDRARTEVEITRKED
jgi:Holliday junction resolvase RusA-like endonuclease